MMTDDWPKGAQHLTHARELLQAVVARRRAEGDRRIEFLEMAPQRTEDGLGAGWHPSLRTHARMAETLVRTVSSPEP